MPRTSIGGFKIHLLFKVNIFLNPQNLLNHHPLLNFRDAKFNYNDKNLTSILTNPSFNNSRATILYFYGSLQTPSTDTVVSLKDAYLLNGDYNFVLFDSDASFYNFIVSRTMLKDFFLNWKILERSSTGWRRGTKSCEVVRCWIESFEVRTCRFLDWRANRRVRSQNREIFKSIHRATSCWTWAS